MPIADAIVVGAGPNGLAAANLLADAGWDVVVLEANDEPGGAVRSGELVEPGFVNDLFSAFYPMGAASPVLRGLELERHGLRWRRAEVVVAHPRLDGTCASLWTDLDRTAANMESFAPGDGDAWRALAALWDRIGDPLVAALLSPFPPLRPAARLVGRLGRRDLLRFARLGVVPVGRLGEEWFAGDGGPRMMAGNALHADFTPMSAGSAVFALILCGLGQQLGFPVPEGGAGRLTEALVRRLDASGGRLELGREVTRIDVRGRRARGVTTRDGERWEARRAVLADVGAPALFQRMVGPEHLPRRFLAALDDFQYDWATVKVDWTLDGPIPWSHPDCRRAGTLHVAEGVDELVLQTGHLNRNRLPDRPFLVMGQYAAFDPTRQPDGGETAWAYAHVPQRVEGDAGPDGLRGHWDEEETRLFADRMEQRVEELAPGFRGLIRGRHVFTPPTMQAADANLVNGAVNGGTAQIHQQLVFRPVPGLARAETPIAGLFLASASAHPGGAVHGACGANAARAALGRMAPRASRLALRGIHGR